MSWFGPNLDCSCCCIPPTVTCDLRSGTARTFDYTITNAETAWFVKTCYVETIPTYETVSIDPVNGSFTAEPNCFYTLYAEGCGETVSVECRQDLNCVPCGLTLGEFIYGVITIRDIPSTYTSPCSVGGWSGITWSGFGSWNGTFVWSNIAAPTYLQLGIGTVTTPFTSFQVKYGLRFQCQRVDLGWAFGTDNFDATGFFANDIAWHTRSTQVMSGACNGFDTNVPGRFNRYVPNLSSVPQVYINTCSTTPLSPPPNLPAIFATFEWWFVTEFS